MKKLLHRLMSFFVISSFLFLNFSSHVHADQVPFEEINLNGTQLSYSVSLTEDENMAQTFTPSGNVITSIQVYLKDRVIGEKIDLVLKKYNGSGWDTKYSSQNHVLYNSGDGYETFEMNPGKTGGYPVDAGSRYAIFIKESEADESVRWAYTSSEGGVAYEGGFMIRNGTNSYDYDFGFKVLGVSCTDTCESLGYECGYANVCYVFDYCGSCAEGSTCEVNTCIEDEVSMEVPDEEQTSPSETDPVQSEETTTDETTSDSNETVVTESGESENVPSVDTVSVSEEVAEDEDQLKSPTLKTLTLEGEEQILTEDSITVIYTNGEELVVIGNSLAGSTVVLSAEEYVWSTVTDENGEWTIKISEFVSENSLVNFSATAYFEEQESKSTVLYRISFPSGTEEVKTIGLAEETSSSSEYQLGSNQTILLILCSLATVLFFLLILMILIRHLKQKNASQLKATVISPEITEKKDLESN